jgi:hypothetical protein
MRRDKSTPRASIAWARFHVNGSEASVELCRSTLQVMEATAPLSNCSDFGRLEQRAFLPQK